ncbi:HNH endonuclease [Planotetraspora sp. A-T 1434]|uniref:HNH endonuclease signature motif containing protein n=1 Tax=Planotetraspora sp. A-T 1434 TaxID=2979219 RepID=UPI0021C06816|nr:HNH endonuclease signature motif containing protein [Planotetraspora sp. A-T 1434]MCT9932773.1 HNH endonuclease [Planotetraspora sp. A-T 1434]
MIVERQQIPEGLARMAPGPGLAAVLDGLDIARLSGYDAVLVLQAYARLEAHVQARKAAVMAEVGLYEPSPGDMKKMPRPDKYSADEIRAALVLTRRAAEREYVFAYDLSTRLAAVRHALAAGTIDKARALVFHDWLEGVPDPLAHAVAGHLLPKAGACTTGQLQDKIKTLLVAADPQWARRKYERALQRRRLEGMRHADGTATITGHQLPVDQAAAAIARVDAIAQQAKRAGLHAPIDHIRTDVFLGLLDGTLAGLDDDAITAILFTKAHNPDPLDTEDDYDPHLNDNPHDNPHDNDNDNDHDADQPHDNAYDAGRPHDGRPNDDAPDADRPHDNAYDAGRPHDGWPYDDAPDAVQPYDNDHDAGRPHDGRSHDGRSKDDADPREPADSDSPDSPDGAQTLARTRHTDDPGAHSAYGVHDRAGTGGVASTDATGGRRDGDGTTAANGDGDGDGDGDGTDGADGTDCPGGVRSGGGPNGPRDGDGHGGGQQPTDTLQAAGHTSGTVAGADTADGAASADAGHGAADATTHAADSEVEATTGSPGGVAEATGSLSSSGVAVEAVPEASGGASAGNGGNAGGGGGEAAAAKAAQGGVVAGLLSGGAGFAAGEVRVRVSTLMHLDDLPAELAGWGPIHAQLARRLAKRQINGEWRFAICDDDGQLLFAGITSYRPAGWPRYPTTPTRAPRQQPPRQQPPQQPSRPQPPPAAQRAWDRAPEPPSPQVPPPSEQASEQASEQGSEHAEGQAAGQASEQAARRAARRAAVRTARGSVRRRGIVELQIPLALLRRWHSDLAALGAGWARVITDITRQLDDAMADSHTTGAHTDSHAEKNTGEDGQAQAAEAPSEKHQTWGGRPVRGRNARPKSVDQRRRFARAGLRRWVQIRDRVCTHPGCRAPATRSELDHTHQHGHGGPTTDRNLGAACAHDHDLRDHGWRVIQPQPGHLIWISRTGHRYPVTPPPIIEPLPEPIIPAIPAIPATPETVPEDDLPLPSTFEYAPPWCEEPLPQTPADPAPPEEVAPEQSTQPPADPAEDLPPF